MRILALDLGTSTTGLAFGDTDFDVLAALDSFRHRSIAELVAHIKKIITEKKIDRLAIGLPLLLDGSEGEQARWTKEIGDQLSSALQLTVDFIDERFTNPRKSVGKKRRNDHNAAACSVLEIAMKMANEHS